MSDLQLELDKEVKMWVRSTFNQIPLTVLEAYIESEEVEIFDHIVRDNPNDVKEEFMNSLNATEYIEEFNEFSDVGIDVETFRKSNILNFNDCVRSIADEDILEEFNEWLVDTYDSELQEFIDQDENYPLWGTVFEFNDSIWNSEEVTKACRDLGMGIIERLDPFNNIVFFTSGGHSFYSAYWIPLYLNTHEKAKEKYQGVNFQGL